MKNENGTPVTKLDPVEVLRAQVAQSLREKFTAIEIRPATARTLLRSLMAERDAKASALDALVEAAMVLVQHAQEAYPHFEDTRGQADIAATLAALSAAKAAQVSK